MGAGVVVLGAFGVRAFAARRREAEERDRRTGKLAREANALLVGTDERVRTASQEIDYVEAAHGKAETEPLRAAVAGTRIASVRLRDPPAARRRRARGSGDSRGDARRDRRAEPEAQASLDREAARIKELRDLERDAPTVLTEIVPRIEAAEQRLPAGDRR